MNQQLALQFGRDAIAVTLMLVAWPLGFALVVGMVVSVFQAVTQINETTLAFVPKILAVFVSFVVFGPWMLNTMLTYATSLFAYMPTLAK